MPEMFSSIAYWVHSIDPFIVRFPESIGGGLRWYGFAYVAGFAVAYFLLHLYYKRQRSDITPEQQATLMTALILGALMGGRLGYKLLYDFDGLLDDPLSLLRVWEGGMASHGGFLGVLIAILWFCKTTGKNFWTVSDLVVTLAPAGILFGRLANFINGELWGKVTNVPWAVIFPQSAPYSGMPLEFIEPRHPSQLYAAALEGLFLLVYTQIRFWTAKPREKNLPPGQLGGEFILLYAIVRILGEQFREPDATLIFDMSRGIFYSIFFVAAGILLIARARTQRL